MNLGFYRLLAPLTPPLYAAALPRRAKRGKEDPLRQGERWARAMAPRPQGKLIWFHAASVGESLALLSLFRRLRAARPDVSILLTTCTVTSTIALENAGLPDGVTHQYSPVDTPGACRRFLAHWRPDICVVAEFDLWPELLAQTKATGMPMLLINTRVSDRRLKARQKAGRLYSDILKFFDAILLQDDPTLPRMVELGAQTSKMRVIGALKSAAEPLPDQPEPRAAFEAAVGDRPVWVAGSANIVEAPNLMRAQAILKERAPGTLFLLAPRHTFTAPDWIKAAKAEGLSYALRSEGALPTPDTDVYIADTTGEMGIWYRAAPISFIGNSLPATGPALTGKNPFEAIQLGSMILHGPDLGNFQDSYERLAAAKAALQVDDAQALADAVLQMQDEGARAPFIAAATGVVQESQSTLDETEKLVLETLART